MRKFKYTYIKQKDPSVSQYEGIQFCPGIAVDAVYVKSFNEYDRGNPFIEALPIFRNEEQIKQDYTIKVINKTDSNKSLFEKTTEIPLLNQVRFSLPFYASLESETYKCLVNSYRNREFLNAVDHEYAVIGNSLDAASVGFNLLGGSGSGKSSALKILLSRYPQVINHHLENIGEFKQIVYLVVNAVPNDNFNAFYISLGHAIDKALGFGEQVYEKEIQKQRGLGQKAEMVQCLIEKFSIGMIIIDEIQMMSFSTSSDRSYTSLARMANITKVAISAVGLPEAVNSMFHREWTGRRLGETIVADRYCSEIKYFKLNLVKLLEYNWLKYPITVTKEGCKEFFHLTKGHIAYIVSVYMRIQLENITSNQPVVIDEKYIQEIMDKYYPGLVKIINSTSMRPSTTAMLDQIQNEQINEANSKLASDIDEKAQEYSMQREIEKSDNLSSTASHNNIKYIIDMVSIYDSRYNEATVLKILNQILKQLEKKGETMTDQELLSKVCEKLRKIPTDKRPAENLSLKALPEQVKTVILTE